MLIIFICISATVASLLTSAVIGAWREEGADMLGD